MTPYRLEILLTMNCKFAFFLMFVTIWMSASPAPAIPDSLKSVSYTLNDISRSIEALKADINTPEDYELHRYELEYLCDDLEKVKVGTPSMSDFPELKAMYIQCKSSIGEIDKKIEVYRRGKVTDSLIKVASVLEQRFDSVLLMGHVLEEHKRGDSVKMLKQNMDVDLWPDVQMLRSQYSTFMSENEELAECVSRIESKRVDIKELSEKERPKIGDILLKVLVVVGVLTMIGGVVVSRLQSRKIQKKAKAMQQQAEAMMSNKNEDVYEL